MYGGCKHSDRITMQRDYVLWGKVTARIGNTNIPSFFLYGLDDSRAYHLDYAHVLYEYATREDGEDANKIDVKERMYYQLHQHYYLLPLALKFYE